MAKNFLVIFCVSVLSFFACNRSDPSKENGNVVDTTTQNQRTTNLPVDTTDRLKFLITDQQAGPFKIGNEIPGPAHMMTYQMRMEEMTRYTEEGPQKEVITIIGENGEDLLLLKPSADNNGKSIGEIIIVSPKYATEKQIGIGSPISDVKAAYPDYRIWYTYVSEMFVMETPQVKVQFILDPADYIGPKPEIKSEITPLKIENFKLTGKIKTVRII